MRSLGAPRSYLCSCRVLPAFRRFEAIKTLTKRRSGLSPFCPAAPRTGGAQFPLRTTSAMAAHGRPAAAGRRFFDKVARDPNARWNARDDGPKFVAACLAFEDEMDLLYRLAHSKVCSHNKFRRLPT
jgi:hypothetical protein